MNFQPFLGLDAQGEMERVAGRSKLPFGGEGRASAQRMNRTLNQAALPTFGARTGAVLDAGIAEFIALRTAIDVIQGVADLLSIGRESRRRTALRYFSLPATKLKERRAADDEQGPSMQH